MEIAPIPGIRAVTAVPAAQPRSNGFDLPAVFAVQDSSRAGDETYNGKKASTGGQDDEDGLDDGADEAIEEIAFADEEDAEAPPLRTSGPVNFFA